MVMAGSMSEQLFLVPARSGAELSRWRAAVARYADAFPAVRVSNDWVGAYSATDRIVVVEPDAWPDDLWMAIIQNPRKPIIERLFASSPEILGALLRLRVGHGLPFGFKTRDDWALQWKRGVSLVGLNGRAGRVEQADIDTIKTAWVEAVKIDSRMPVADMWAVKSAHPSVFFMAHVSPRKWEPRPRGEAADYAAEFAEMTIDDLETIFDVDPSLEYVEIYGEPNLASRGWGALWKDGREFTDWFSRVLFMYRRRWPEKKFGFPCLSSGEDISGIQQDAMRFLREASLAAASADWIAVSSHWQSDSGVGSADAGEFWQLYRQRFPDHLLFVTKFGNPVQDKRAVAQQYLQYYSRLRGETGIGGAFAHVVSSPDRAEAGWAWRDEHGQDAGIAKWIGAFMESPGLFDWPLKRCLVGVHGRADGPMREADFQAVADARVEAVKLMSTARPDDVDRLLKINPDMFIMVRLFADFRDRVVSAGDFAAWIKDDMRRFYERGVRHYEIHNEPNTALEGWGASWADGVEFSRWFLEVFNTLKAEFPLARLGYPGLSPGRGGARMSALEFLEQSREAVEAADWIGCHCYWIDDATFDAPEDALNYMEYRRRFPTHLTFVTEFSNPLPDADKTMKGNQYVDFYRRAREVFGLGAAFSFVLSASSPRYMHEAWLPEVGEPSGIPGIVGAREF